MKFFAGIILSALIALPVLAQNRLEFDNYGFSVEKLEIADNEKDNLSQTVYMFLPADGQPFLPNINIQIQKYAGTVEQYQALSESQFEQMGAKMIDKKKSKDMLTYEYTANMNNMELHIYTKALFKDGKVYLITGTALVTQWEKSGPALKKNVDSLKLTDSGKKKK